MARYSSFSAHSCPLGLALSLQAVQDRNAAPLQEAAAEEHSAWLGQALSRPAAAPDALVDFLVGSTRSGLPISPSLYACMQQYCQVGRWAVRSIAC